MRGSVSLPGKSSRKPSRLKVVTGIRAGGVDFNHSRTLARVGSPRINQLARKAVAAHFQAVRDLRAAASRLKARERAIGL